MNKTFFDRNGRKPAVYYPIRMLQALFNLVVLGCMANCMAAQASTKKQGYPKSWIPGVDYALLFITVVILIYFIFLAVAGYKFRRLTPAIAIYGFELVVCFYLFICFCAGLAKLPSKDSSRRFWNLMYYNSDGAGNYEYAASTVEIDGFHTWWVSSAAGFACTALLVVMFLVLLVFIGVNTFTNKEDGHTHMTPLAIGALALDTTPFEPVGVAQPPPMGYVGNAPFPGEQGAFPPVPLQPQGDGSYMVAAGAFASDQHNAHSTGAPAPGMVEVHPMVPMVPVVPVVPVAPHYSRGTSRGMQDHDSVGDAFLYAGASDAQLYTPLDPFDDNAQYALTGKSPYPQ